MIDSNKMHKPILIVIAGPNGSGKTTMTSKILKHQWLEDAVYINPDNVAQERFGGWNDNAAVFLFSAMQHQILYQNQPLTHFCGTSLNTVRKTGKVYYLAKISSQMST